MGMNVIFPSHPEAEMPVADNLLLVWVFDSIDFIKHGCIKLHVPI